MSFGTGVKRRFVTNKGGKVHPEECACTFIPKKEPATEIKKCSKKFKEMTNLSAILKRQGNKK